MLNTINRYLNYSDDKRDVCTYLYYLLTYCHNIGFHRILPSLIIG